MDEADIAAADTGEWIAIVPLGATEQHGAHLPLETDSIIATELAGRLVQRVRAEIPATVLPTETVGYSPEHLDYAGTVSLGWDEAIKRWIGIGERLADLGLRKLVWLNAHGGNSPLMAIVATELRVRRVMLAVTTSWTRFAPPQTLIGEDERAFGIHGGDLETSVMLALRPDLVDMSRARNEPSAQRDFASRFTHLRAYGPHGFGWKMADLNPAGVTGNAVAATADKGEAILAHTLDRLAELIADVHRFDLKGLR